MIKVYLIHKKGLITRLHKVIDLLCTCNMVEDIEIITSENSNLKFSTAAENAAILPPDFPHRVISDGNKSLYHKQFRAFEKIAIEGKPAIIFEDDVLFDPAAVDAFITNLHTIPSDWEFCFFGTGCNLKLSGTGFVKNNNKFKSKCTDSMVIHPVAARIMFNDLKNDKAYMAIDWDLNYRFIKLNTVVYWYEPGITAQGSQNGTYPSLC